MKLSATRQPRRRNVLFMPGDDLHKIQKGAALIGVDTVVMDLEDGVALSRKQEARETTRRALATVDFGPVERLVRLNAAESGLARDDLLGTIEGHPDGYVLPKVESPVTIRVVSRYLEQFEHLHGWPVGSTRLFAVVETARGIMSLDGIAGADPRLQALFFGAEDLATSLGASRSPDRWELFYGRSAVVMAAAAYDLQAVDTVYTALDDSDGLREDAQRALQMGYDGKLAIHPRQVPVINEVFTPSQDEVERAHLLIRAFEEYQQKGTGAFQLDGRMVDRPMLVAAQRVLRRAALTR